ncbi:FAD-dependent monooxygenase [Pseudonocardia acaciae]|uniref:FAD-dependent monooxygenase n=1 Tax=Pseudonocardia acaciae TaxID=551276 RepID=UPI000687C0F1|nr:FAD-dependent monooxygenase [Pseudonocardia acaciae]
MRTIGTPVLIVGRGPVGMTLALRLARFGVASVLVDRLDSEIRLSSKAVLMHGESAEVLHRAGVGDEVRSRGIALTGSRTFYRNHELVHDRFPATSHGYPMAVNFPQSETERALLARVRAEPLIDLHLRTTVRDIAVDDAGVTANLDTDAGGLRVRAEYVAGCDGARSTVRKWLPVEFVGHSHDEHYLIVDIRADLALPPERRFFFDPPTNPRRTILVHPQLDNLWHLDYQVGPAPDIDEEVRTGRLDRRIRGVIGAARYELVWSTTYVFKQLLASRFSHGRVFLAGDAAHLYAPYGARGLNSGFADADNLAWKLAWVLLGRAPRELLDTYDLERRGAAVEHFAATSASARFMAPTTRRGRLYRDLVLAAAARVPWAKRLVDSGRFYSPPGYPRSPIVDASGEIMPDIPLRQFPDQRQVRLRDFVGDAFLLVHFAPDAHSAASVSSALATRAGLETLTIVPPGAVSGGVRNLAEGEPPPGMAGRLLLVRPDCHIAVNRDAGSAAEVCSRVGRWLDLALGHRKQEGLSQA